MIMLQINDLTTMMIKIILNYMMNTQTQILNPSYSLRQSTLSMGKPQAPANIYATSQVNVFPGNPQQQYFVTSTRPSQQVNASFQAQALSASQLNTYSNQKPIPYSVYLSQNKQVTYTEKKQSQSRITYHPYVRTYIDYEERVVLVPVERVKINYYQKIYETQYVPQAIEEIVTETVPMEKEVFKVQYVPVQQKIVHFPKEQIKAGSVGQRQRKIIYYDANGQQITKSRHEAVLKSNFTNFVTTSQKNFIPHVQVQQTVAQPIHFTFHGNKNEVNQAQPIHFTFHGRKNEVNQAQIVKPQNESEIYHEEAQIIFNETKQQNRKRLGESQVKQVFKSTVNT